MYKDKTIMVVVPAHNEEKLVGKVIETMPELVDKIIVVNDCSTDSTPKVVQKYIDDGNDKVFLLNNEKNLGVGGAILNGHKKALELGVDISCVMAGDAQMDPDYLTDLLDAVIDENYDYAKANRFYKRSHLVQMPKLRVFGNMILTFMTKKASGYWHIFDPQNGYTAIKREVLEELPIDSIDYGYAFENCLLVYLNVYDFRVKDVPIPAIYGEEKSGIKLHKFMPRTWRILRKLYKWRIRRKYLIGNFHPLALFYIFGRMFAWAGGLFGLWLIIARLFFDAGSPTVGTVMLAVLPFLMGFQMVLQAMVMDIQEGNKLA